MSWPLYLAAAFTPGGLAARLTEEPAVTSGGAELAAPFLGYGVVGVLVLVLGWIVYKGLFTRTDVAEARITAVQAESDKRVADARADLLRENSRLIEENDRLRGALSEEQRFTRTDLVPLLVQFTQVTTALIPLMQRQLSSTQEDERGPRGHRG